ncbi:pro-sigmaK processing inhibitor BofA family protein [Alteribacillus iranensis]|uniref:Inhibitor of the pro-sigma K processing machinery n=1 Tax=Alteribacillus iranensis TaxID=930128 RepID=A0A1I2C6X5_9BACI|nr:pro-sigmaK processing inhibitor BofA family protein [Alteribacillus iranensis]SFE64057.1 inhibitor of the pro-sigma K processing machinery [Alteribacillus iranensis]
MDPIVIASLAGIGICLFLLLGPSTKWMKWTGSIFVRLVVGAVALFLLNVFGGVFEYHLPINLFTVSVSGLLGFPGVLMLVAVDLFILPF